VLDRFDPCRWLAFLPAGQLRHVGESNGTQRHVIRFPPACASHAMQIQHRLCISRLAAFEIRDIKATDLHPVACKDGAIRCSHTSILLVCTELKDHAVSCHQSFTHSSSKNESSALGSGRGPPGGTVTATRIT